MVNMDNNPALVLSFILSHVFKILIPIIQHKKNKNHILKKEFSRSINVTKLIIFFVSIKLKQN